VPDTLSKFFSAVIESGPGTPWVDPDKVLNSSTGQATSTSDTRTLELSTPLAGADIPPGQVITDIQMTVQWFRGAGNTINGELTIAGGITNTFVISEPPSTGEVYPGDLAYWGITALQAQNFANGSGGSVLALVMTEDSGPNSVACGWVKCQFTYEAAPPSDSLIFPPVI
jgi:hypothetical protein